MAHGVEDGIVELDGAGDKEGGMLGLGRHVGGIGVGGEGASLCLGQERSVDVVRVPLDGIRGVEWVIGGEVTGDEGQPSGGDDRAAGAGHRRYNSRESR